MAGSRGERDEDHRPGEERKPRAERVEQRFPEGKLGVPGRGTQPETHGVVCAQHRCTSTSSHLPPEGAQVVP